MVKVTDLSNFPRIYHHEVGPSQSTNMLILGVLFFPSALSLSHQITIAPKGAKTEFSESE